MTQPRNVQDGRPIGPVEDSGAVAHGDRRDEVHYEPDPDQGVRVVHEDKLAYPPAPELVRGDATETQVEPGVTQVAQVPDGPSSWDASPAPGEDSAAGKGPD